MFIVNPVSGNRRKKKHIIAGLRGYEVRFTEYPGHATEIARETSADIVVAVGGDGTVNEVARGLVGTDKILGIVPCGSGDGLALHLKIGRGFRKALRIIEKGKTAPLDYGTIDGRPFFSVCGVGLDAIVSERFAKAGRRGLSTYIREAFRTWKGFVPDNYRIRLDGSVMDLDAVLVTIGNSNQWGNGAKVTPLARTDDGELDVTIVETFRSIEIPLLAWRLMTGTFDRSRRGMCFRARNIEIERNSGGPAHFDGDFFGAGEKIAISLAPDRLRVLVP